MRLATCARVPAWAVTCFLTAGAHLVFADERVERLPADLRTWLETDVVYIITDAERERFLSLDTNQQREWFIEAFWDQREPDRRTPVNEAREEHYRRLAEVERRFGEGTSMPGWKTDRGRYYILLGEPLRIERFYGSNEVVTSELWLYGGEPGQGLPVRFNLVFFKRDDIGDYRLYNPTSDRPHALLRAGHSVRDQIRDDPTPATDILAGVSFELARASLTVDLSDAVGSFMARRPLADPDTDVLPPSFVQPSPGSDLVIANIIDLPERTVDTSYLEASERYGDRVSAEASFHFIPNRHFWTVLYDGADSPVFQYSVELAADDVALDRSEGGHRFHTTLEANLEIHDSQDRLIASQSKQPFLELVASAMDGAKPFSVAFQDSLPLLPGIYQVSLLVRNLVSQHYTVVDESVEILAPTVGEPRLGGVILAFDASELDRPSAGGELFEMGALRFAPSVGSVFAAGSSVVAGVQTLSAYQGDSVHAALSGGGTIMWEASLPVQEGDASVVHHIPLAGATPGEYLLQLRLQDEDGAVSDETVVPLRVVPEAEIERAGLVYREGFAVEVEGLVPLTLGEQAMRQGRLELAETHFRRSMEAQNPELPMAQWHLASVLLFARRAEEALQILEPIEDDFPDQIEVIEGLGFSYYLQQNYGKALPYFEHAMAVRPPDTSLLNAAGDCFQQLNMPDKARRMFELSIGANPNQPGVRARLAELHQ